MKRHALTIGAGVIALALVVSGRVTAAAAQRAIDVDLLLVLFALLVSVELLRVSGYLDRFVAQTVTRFRTTRAFAIALIAFSGALASLVTNDVTLFVVIPFTVVASRFSDFDVEDAVILEVIASNLIGCLTPLGNPQNLFVFAGGCGTIIASLANLLGWRIYVRETAGVLRKEGFFRRLTVINFAFLAWATIGGYVILKAKR